MTILLSVWQASRSGLSEGLPKDLCTGQALGSPLESSLMLGIRVSTPSVPPPRGTFCSLLLLGFTRPAHRPPGWNTNQSSSSAAFHTVHHLIGHAMPSCGCTSCFTAPLCSLFPAQVGTGQWMPVFLWGPQIFTNDYFNTPPYLLSCFFGFQGLDDGVGHLFCLGYLGIVRC